MASKYDIPPAVGVAAFTDARTTGFAGEKERYAARVHQETVEYLQAQGFRVVDGMAFLRADEPMYGIRSSAEVRRVAAEFARQEVDCLVLGCGSWSDPMLSVAMVREANLPVCLHTAGDPQLSGAGVTALTAVGSSLWEVAPNSHALTHERVREHKAPIATWVRGVAALGQLRRSSILLWGGSYCLKMDHLQDDFPRLKSFLIGDVLSEDQYLLVRGAERLLAEQPDRIGRFLAWAQDAGLKIEFDSAMLTQQSLERQVALYLAARDRLDALEEENVVAISIKCQPELSVEWGTTACSLPAFLPLSEDSEGERRMLPTVCEGDTKGALTCALLARLAPEVPPLFGDLKDITDSGFVISNCGGAAAYWGNYGRGRRPLEGVSWAAQCQGASGGALGYHSPPEQVTVARLVRIAGEYSMQLGLGRVVEMPQAMRQGINWGLSWPHTTIDLGIDPYLLLRAAGSNHYCATLGDRTAELMHACREAGISVQRLDSNAGLQHILDTVPRRWPG